MQAFKPGTISLLIAVFVPEIFESVTVPFCDKEVKEFFLKLFTDAVKHRRVDNFRRQDFVDLLMQLMDHGTVEEDNVPSTITAEDKTGIMLMNFVLSV